MESGREVRFSQGKGIPIQLPCSPLCPAAPHAQPLPGLPLLNLSQPLLLGHHLLPLSLHVAPEGPHDVALLVSVGLWGQDRDLSWGPLYLLSLDLAQPHAPPCICVAWPLSGLNFLTCKMGKR